MVLGLEGWDSDTVTDHVNLQCLYYVTERPSYIENRIYTVRYLTVNLSYNNVTNITKRPSFIKNWKL